MKENNLNRVIGWSGLLLTSLLSTSALADNIGTSAEELGLFFLLAMQQTSHRSVALWRQVIVPAAGHSARLHCDNAGSAQRRTLFAGQAVLQQS